MPYTPEQITDRTSRVLDTLVELLPEESPQELLETARKLAPLDLDGFNAIWQRRRANYPNWLSLVEGQIIAAILDDAFAQEDIQVSVFDGEDVVCPATRDRASVEKEVAQTDVTYLNFYRHADQPNRVGTVMLVHGNENDVICDCTDNEWTVSLLARAEKLAEDLR